MRVITKAPDPKTIEELLLEKQNFEYLVVNLELFFGCEGIDNNNLSKECQKGQ